MYLNKVVPVPNYFLSILLILMIPASNCIFPWCIPLDKNSRNNCFYLEQNLVIGIIFLLINFKLPSRNSPLNVVQFVGSNLFWIVEMAGSKLKEKYYICSYKLCGEAFENFQYSYLELFKCISWTWYVSSSGKCKWLVGSHLFDYVNECGKLIMVLVLLKSY